MKHVVNILRDATIIAISWMSRHTVVMGPNCACQTCSINISGTAARSRWFLPFFRFICLSSNALAYFFLSCAILLNTMALFFAKCPWDISTSRWCTFSFWASQFSMVTWVTRGNYAICFSEFFGVTTSPFMTNIYQCIRFTSYSRPKHKWQLLTSFRGLNYC